MDFKLTKDLCFIDLEATGLNVIRERIVQIAIIKYPAKGGDPTELTMLINPGIPISEEAMSVHHIMPKDLANKPTFQQVAQKIYDFIGDADIAGYNSNRFDVPMLMEEFARVGIEFDISKRRLVDIQRIFYRMEPRTLKAALQFYCGQDMEDQHDALADVKATIEVFKGQLRRYEGVDLHDEEGNIIPQPIRKDIQLLHDFTNDTKMLEPTQRLRNGVDGTVVFNFGKYMNQSVVEVLSKDRQYYHWIMNKDFSTQVKQIVKKLMTEYEKNKPK